MKIEAFKQKHLPILRGWLKAYDLEENIPIPQIGFIAMDDDAVAAGFLRRVEGQYALFDGLIANPKSSGKRRYNAINKIVVHLLEEAKRLDIVKILAFTSEVAVLKRAIQHGFEIQQDRYMSKVV